MFISLIMIASIELDTLIDSIDEAWSPVDLAYVNDQVVRAALFNGSYHWHKHDEEDELFFVYRGGIRILLDKESIELGEGEICVVPKGVLHKPEADYPSIVLLFEPRKLKSRGD